MKGLSIPFLFASFWYFMVRFGMPSTELPFFPDVLAWPLIALIFLWCFWDMKRLAEVMTRASEKRHPFKARYILVVLVPGIFLLVAFLTKFEPSLTYFLQAYWGLLLFFVLWGIGFYLDIRRHLRIIDYDGIR